MCLLLTVYVHVTGVLNALCCSSKDSPGYIDVLGQVGLRDPHSTPTIHSSLAVFTAILIARHCFTLPDFLKCVALPSLMEAWNTGKKITVPPTSLYTTTVIKDNFSLQNQKISPLIFGKKTKMTVQIAADMFSTDPYSS